MAYWYGNIRIFIEKLLGEKVSCGKESLIYVFLKIQYNMLLCFYEYALLERFRFVLEGDMFYENGYLF